jgi:Phosphotransferase enzyme family
VTRLRLTGLLRHPGEPRVLLFRGDRTWRPPRVLVRERTWIADARAVVPPFERRLGTRPWLLRQLGFHEDEPSNLLEAVQELELVDTGWRQPGNGRWAGREHLGRLRLADEHRELVASYLDRLEDVPDARPGWSRPGWRSQLRDWLEAELARLGRRLVALEQAKVWGISTVVRVETDRGDLWFKASAPLPLFADEADVTQRLAARFHGYVPEPVAVEPERGWILFEPFDVLGWHPTLDDHRALFRRFASLQLRTVELTPALLADGCLDRRLPVLERQLDQLLADRRALHRLDARETRALRRLAPHLHGAIRRLDALGLPPTLVHGDLHPGNATRLAGKIAYFDWTDACVAHPFVDLHSLQWERDDAIREALLDAYLEPWRAAASEETLREAVTLARVVTPLHHAVSYATIASSLEPTSRPELDATHTFLREAVAGAREL